MWFPTDVPPFHVQATHPVVFWQTPQHADAVETIGLDRGGRIFVPSQLVPGSIAVHAGGGFDDDTSPFATVASSVPANPECIGLWKRRGMYKAGFTPIFGQPMSVLQYYSTTVGE